MGQPHRCLAAWLLVALTALALSAPEDAENTLACSDQRPSQPQQLRLKAIPNTSSIGALWDSPGNNACVDNYIVLVRPAAGASKEPSPHKVRSRSVIVSNLKPNTMYRVDVVPVSRKRGTGPFATATITTLTGPSCNPRTQPGQPQRTQAKPSNSRNDRVTVTWAPPKGSGNACVNGYRVEGFDAGTGAKVVSINLGRDIQELNVNGLVPGTKYNFVVVAKSGAGDSPQSTVQVTTLGKAPSPPPAPAPAPAPALQQPATYTPLPAAPAQLASAPAAAAPAVTTDSSEEVEFKQPAAAQPATSTTDCRSDVEPAAPQSFTATPIGKDKMNLSWQNGDPGICTLTYKIDAYQLKTGDRVIGTETGFNSYTLTKLAPGVEYAFTVAAVNSKGDSIPATAMSSTPKTRR